MFVASCCQKQKSKTLFSDVSVSGKSWQASVMVVLMFGRDFHLKINRQLFEFLQQICSNLQWRQFALYAHSQFVCKIWISKSFRNVTPRGRSNKPSQARCGPTPSAPRCKKPPNLKSYQQNGVDFKFWKIACGCRTTEFIEKVWIEINKKHLSTRHGGAIGGVVVGERSRALRTRPEIILGGPLFKFANKKTNNSNSKDFWLYCTNNCCCNNFEIFIFCRNLQQLAIDSVELPQNSIPSGPAFLAS